MKCGNLFGDLGELENSCRTTIRQKLFIARCAVITDTPLITKLYS